MIKKRHVDYVRDYCKNLVPVIPHDATLSPNSTIPPGNRGKVPGERKEDGTWRGIAWNKMGDATMALARKWDEWGAYIGNRTGFDGVIALDVDLTVREDADAVLELARQLFGKNLAVRRVDHPDHTKLLICLRLEGPMPASFNLDIVQSDGAHGQIQFLGPGRYFNMHGVHPKRLKPYIWERDPADEPLTSVNLVEFESFWAAIGKDFEVAHRPRLHAFNQVQREPERCTPEDMDALIELLPNDETFEAYNDFVTMGAAMHGASAGADWGRVRWLAWCGQVDQPQDRKPEIFWDSMHQARVGADMLRKFANARQPLEMARRDFANPPIEDVAPELVAEADADAELARSFLEDWCLVGGAEFYALPPGEKIAPAAFGFIHEENKTALHRALGNKKMSLARIFARKSPNKVAGLAHEPGQPRFIERRGQRLLNLWSPPPRPRQGKRVDPALVEFYRDLVEFVLGSPEETALWLRWHAWMLQNPGRAPGWQWVVQTGPGMGKDLILLPIGLAHGDDYTPITPKDLAAPYNDYAEKHLISTSEMKMRGTDDGPYVMLKAITSGGPTVPIRVQYRRRYLAANVAGFVIFSNEEHPLKIDHDDRRLHVVSNFDVATRRPEYYIHARQVFENPDNWAMLGEHLHTLPLSDAERNQITGNAPASEAKIEMAAQIAESAILDIIGEIESDKPPPHYLPIATTGDVRDWLEKHEGLRSHEIPNRNELPALLYRLGARPLNPHRKKSKRAEPIQGARLWRVAKTWNGWNLETATPARLARLYFDRAMPPADLKAVDEGEV